MTINLYYNSARTPKGNIVIEIFHEGIVNPEGWHDRRQHQSCHPFRVMIKHIMFFYNYVTPSGFAYLPHTFYITSNLPIEIE
jgi:hypothetical protein